MRSIFISSTFRDMQAERDILHQQVFPVLRKRLAAYGEDVQELDLRWGVDTSRLSEEKSGEYVIESCIDSIDRCKPYMVVLLGSRYGWVPEQRTIDSTADERIKNWYESGSSITHLEISYGALRTGITPDRCVFCFRNEDFPDTVPENQRDIYTCESPAHQQKLQALKARIRSREDAHILDYTAAWDSSLQAPGHMDTFAAELTEALWKILSQDLDTAKAEVCPEEQIFRDAQLTARQYLSSYVSRRVDREIGPNALVGRSGIWFSGEAGSGKSAMMAKIADNGRKTGVNVFLYYGGNAGCGSTLTLSKTLLWWLNRLVGMNISVSDMMDVNKLALESVLGWAMKKTKKNFAILVDGVDQMDAEARGFLCWLSRLLITDDFSMECWHGIAASSTADFAQRWEQDLQKDFSIRKLDPLNSSELDAIVRSHSARRGKKLDAQVMRRIRAKEQSRNPYYLSLLLQKLFMMDRADFEKAEALAPGMEGLSRFMCREMETMPDTVEEMTIAMLQEACEKLGIHSVAWGESCDAMADPMAVLTLLAASENGLTIAQLSRALELQGLSFPTMFLERLLSYLYDSFSESDKGVWNFKHRLLRESLIGSAAPEAYLRSCNALMRLHMEEQAETEQILYYAWQSRDVKTGLALLEGNAYNLDHFRRLFTQLQQSPSGAAYLAELLREGSESAKCTLLEWMSINTGTSLRFRKEADHILQAAQPEEASGAQHQFRWHLAQAKLCFWDYNTEAFTAHWKQLLQLQAHPGCAGQRSSFLFLCRDVLFQQRYKGLWTDVLAFLEAYAPPEHLLSSVKIDLALARLLVEMNAGKEANDASREAVALRDARNYILENSKGNEGQMRGYRILVAQLALDKGCYQDVIDLLRDLLGTVEGMYNRTEGIMDALYAITALSTVAGALKAENAVKYYAKALQYCQRAESTYPSTLLQYLECEIRISEWNAQKKAGNESQSHKSLEATIPVLDRFVETAGADRIPVEVLQRYLDQRYQRVNLRRTSVYLADKDSEKMSMDAFMSLLKSDFKQPLKVETVIKPWRFFAEQEADFAYMNKHYPPLEARCTSYSVYVDMVYAKMEEIRFYEACGKDKKMIAACQEMIKYSTFLSERKSSGIQWYGLGFRLDLAEVLYRNYYRDFAGKLAETIKQQITSVDTSWVVQTKRVEEYYRRIVRNYMLLASTKMRDKAQVQSALVYIDAALERLNGAEGKPAMSAKHDDLRCEAWILKGEVLRYLGQPGSEAIANTDQFWPENEVESALRSGGHRKLSRLLRYCVGLSIRAREADDPKLMDRAVTCMCRMADTHTDGGNALRWEPLYDALLDACRFYWRKRDTVATPRNLKACMCKAFYEKQKTSELSQNEQIFFAVYGMQEQDAAAAQGRALPNTDLLLKILDRIKALEIKTGRGKLRTRIAMAHALQGSYDAAIALVSDISDLTDITDLRTQLLGSIVLSNLAHTSAPAKPLLPQVSEWLQSPAAREEPFVARFLETAAAVVDSRSADETGLSAAVHITPILKAQIEAMGKSAGNTVLHRWAAQICRRVIKAHFEKPDTVTPEVLKEALMLGNEGISELYKAESDPREKTSLLEELVSMTLLFALLHLEAGDTKKVISYGLGAMRQAVTMEKTPTATLLNYAMKAYGMVRSTMEKESELHSSSVLDLISHCSDTYEGMYDANADTAFLEELLRQMDILRALLPKCTGQSESWVREKTLQTYTIDRAVCLQLAEDSPSEASQLRYLAIAEKMIGQMEEMQQKQLETILSELRNLQPLSPAVEEKILDLVESVTTILRGMPDDLMYLMNQALQELGSDAELPQVEAYVTRRRAEIRAMEDAQQ